MTRVRTLIPLVLFCVLVSPLRASAGLADIIWEMSGPNLIGLGVECHFSLESSAKKCPVLPLLKSGLPQFPTDRIWFTVDARYYFSSTKNSGEEVDKQYDTGSVQMVGVDPMLVYGNIRSNDRWHVSTGAGLSLNRLWGAKVPDPFNNFAFKFKPLEFDRAIGGGNRLGIGYTLRLYPDGFETEGGLRRKEQAEWVQGFIIEVRF